MYGPVKGRTTSTIIMPISRVCVLHIETLEMIPRCQNYKLKLIEAGYYPSLCNLNFQLNYCNINYV